MVPRGIFIYKVKQNTGQTHPPPNEPLAITSTHEGVRKGGVEGVVEPLIPRRVAAAATMYYSCQVASMSSRTDEFSKKFIAAGTAVDTRPA